MITDKDITTNKKAEIHLVEYEDHGCNPKNDNKIKKRFVLIVIDNNNSYFCNPKSRRLKKRKNNVHKNKRKTKFIGFKRIEGSSLK